MLYRMAGKFLLDLVWGFRVVRAVKYVLPCVLAVSAGLSSHAARAEDGGAPYWVSLRKDESNMRVGPGREYRINWTYVRKGLPMKVLRVMGGWRLVEDPDGSRGGCSPSSWRARIPAWSRAASRRCAKRRTARGGCCGGWRPAWWARSAIAAPAGASSMLMAARAMPSKRPSGGRAP
jgi:hypothetical protein